MILLQQSNRRYHFSSLLRPFVHYVPFSVGDIIDKIEWLKRNPRLAEQIALNAQAFAASYLRAEDYQCHVLNMLEVLGDMMHNTSAATPSLTAIEIKSL